MKPNPNTLKEQRQIISSALSKLPQSSNDLPIKRAVKRYKSHLQQLDQLIQKGENGFINEYDLDLGQFFTEFLS